MLSVETHSPAGLESILDQVTRRYETDDLGRLVQDRSGGVPPRFLFGRSAEGCIWRFGVQLERERLIGLAKLAARERGWIERQDAEPAPPERLVMMARMLGESGEAAAADRETLVREGRLHAEIWTFC